MIDHSDMVRKLAKPGQAIVESIEANEAHALHMAIGISGEVAELLEALLEEKTDDIIEECGDIEFYFEGLCQGTGGTIAAKVIPVLEIKRDPIPGLIIGAGNLLDVAKRVAIYKDPSKWTKFPEALQEFRDRLDELYALTPGVTRDRAIAQNISKLSKRYQSMSYSDDAAKNRADKV